MFDGFEKEAKDAFSEAQRVAKSAAASELTDLHLLVGCCRAQGTLAGSILRECSLDPALIAAQAEAGMHEPNRTGATGQSATLSARAREVFAGMLQAAESLGRKEIGSEHVLLGLLASAGPAARILERAGLEPTRVRDAAVRVREAEARKREQALCATPRTRAQILLEAQQVCEEIGQHELASLLHDVAHLLEHR